MRIPWYYDRYHAGTLAALFDRLFTFYLACWLIIHLGRWYHRPIPFLNNWLTDFVFVPVIAHIALVFTRQYILHNTAYRYPLHYLLFAALYVSFIYEWVLPHYGFHTIADPADVIAYFAGSIFYYFVHQANACYSNSGQLDTVIGTRHFIENNFDKELNLKFLSQIRFISKFHLLRLYKRYYGQTPKQYLMDSTLFKSRVDCPRLNSKKKQLSQSPK